MAKGVFCKNCCHVFWDDRSPDMCGQHRIRSCFPGIPYAEYVNQHGECSFYKRKWWKFWVRKK